MAKMMKQIVDSVKSVEVKYRVASQLGFKDILESMISGSDLAYLKDTVWRRGTKYNWFINMYHILYNYSGNIPMKNNAEF